MGRMTERNEKGDLLVNGKIVYAGEFYEVASALEEYEDLEEDGKLLKLPCKPGDTVYMIKDDCEFNGDCHQTRTCKSCEYRNVLIEEDIATLKFIVENIDKFGKTALLTEKEAMERIDRNYLKESQKREDEEQAVYLREWSRRHQKYGRTGKTQ